MTFWNKPLADGQDIKAKTLAPPALSPLIVILFGSPPKEAIFSLIHFKAIISSDKQQFESKASLL